MKTVVGVSLILFGIAFGLYAGIWWAFIGGILQVAHEINAADTSVLALIAGFFRIIFCSAIGWCALSLLVIPGLNLMD